MVDLMGMLQWCRDHIDQLTESEATALHGPLMRACEVGPDGQLSLTVTTADDPFEQHADLWAVVLQIADAYELVPDDELPPNDSW
jgi:hypothetical protein